MRAELELECADPERVIKSIRPDVEPAAKFSARMEPGKNMLKITIESKDMAGLLAGINSYMRLTRAALAVEKLEG